MISKPDYSSAELSPDAFQTRDWLTSLEDVLLLQGSDRARELLQELQIHAQKHGIRLPVTSKTPYVNTISPHADPEYPGNREIERRIKSIIRWNAMSMVVRANKVTDDGETNSGVGGHISTYASAATLYEVGFNHFFKGRDHPTGGDLIYFQGHASPGIYSRAFVEGRLTEDHLLNFRQELPQGVGLSSYPHPWLMPDFWSFPTVSMGLGPICSIYHARFMRYLHDRGIQETEGRKIWAFLGDGETDEPETLGAINLAVREQLDNLIWVINCNLQRLDGPVRGNGKIIQELEATFRGSGWNVIKCIWGQEWDPLFEADETGLLVRRLGEIVDGEYQKYRVEDGAYMREHLFGDELKHLVSHIPDDQLWKMRLGGHDPVKVHSAYKNAIENEGAPTVILAHTIKGYGLGEAGEGKNTAHNQKKLAEDEMRKFRDRFHIPIDDDELADHPFYRPEKGSPEYDYLHERRKQLGGYQPERRVQVTVPARYDDATKIYSQFDSGSNDRGVSTTMAFLQVLRALLGDKKIGKHIVPIVPDEARTFGMEALIAKHGIYSHCGQLYEPVDAGSLMKYNESTDGQILEEGITEAGAMSSWIAASTAYANHGVEMIPFYIYYSMFGFQRVGDLCWLAGDSRSRGFLIGGTAGRTTLNGEGLQHEDGHSHVLFSTVPTCRTYDPSFVWEIAAIVKHGIKTMIDDDEDIFYYLTVGNENWVHPEKPDIENLEEGILQGIYKLKDKPDAGKNAPEANLFGSSVFVNVAQKAQAILADKYGVAANVWATPSLTNLRRDALDTERWNTLHPTAGEQKPYITKALEGTSGPYVFSNDYMKVLSDGLAKWIPGRVVALGTDGFGRSETRPSLRDHFEVDERWMVFSTLGALHREGKIDKDTVNQAQKDLEIDVDKANPHHA